MRNYLAFFFTILLSSFSLSQNLEKSLLWEISGHGLEKPSYLFGTIHMTCDATLGKNVLDALDSTDQLVLELDMDDPSMALHMLKNMKMKDGKTLNDFITEDEFNLLDSFVKEQVGMSLETFANTKPFFISAMCYRKFIDCPIQVVENELIKVTHEQNEEVFGLETVIEQIAIFDEIPYDQQAKDLVKMVQEGLEKSKETFSHMLKLYQEQDIEAMTKLVEEDSTQTISNHSDKLLGKRNENWIPKISEFAKQKPTFFGVGAGHLAGENGIIALLRREGYTVIASY